MCIGPSQLSVVSLIFLYYSFFNFASYRSLHDHNSHLLDLSILSTYHLNQFLTLFRIMVVWWYQRQYWMRNRRILFTVSFGLWKLKHYHKRRDYQTLQWETLRPELSVPLMRKIKILYRRYVHQRGRKLHTMATANNRLVIVLTNHLPIRSTLSWLYGKL